MPECDMEFALGNRRNTSGRVIRDQSVAEGTISAPGVRSQARRTNIQALEGQPEIAFGILGVFPPRYACSCAPTQPFTMPMPIPDEDGSDDEWLAKAKQNGIRVRSQRDALVCVVDQDDLEKTEAIPIPFMAWKSKASRRTNLSTFGAEASACRDALDLAEYTRAMLCEVVIGTTVFPDEWTEVALAYPSCH